LPRKLDFRQKLEEIDCFFEKSEKVKGFVLGKAASAFLYSYSILILGYWKKNKQPPQVGH